MFALVQPTLPGLIAAMTDNTAQGLGVLGERYALKLLEQSGYRVVLQGRGQPGDLKAVCPGTGESFIIEVKTARKASDGYYRFTLFKRGKTDHRRSDVILLLVVTPAGLIVPFVIPSQFLSQQQAIVISRHPDEYTGKLSRFRQSSKQVNLETTLKEL